MPLKDIKKLAIISGSGDLPRHVAESCEKSKVPYIVVALENNTSLDIINDHPSHLFKVHAISKILTTLKKEGISHVTLCGKVSRANLPKLILDFKGAKLLHHILKRGLSDSSLLSTIMSFIEGEGFEIVAPESVASDIILKKGVAGKARPNDAAMKDIKQGLKILKGVAEFDVGQALVIQSGLVLGVEAAEGTDELIKRCGEIQQSGDAPILVKVCKPNQDKRVDLPCIGPTTIEMVKQFGLQGIAAEADSTLIINPVKTLKLADKYKIFVIGI